MKTPTHIIQAVPNDVAGLLQVAETPYSFGDRHHAIKTGFLIGCAEQGVSPEEAEEALIKCASLGNAVAAAPNALVKGTLAFALLGALAGHMTGKTHYSMVRRLDKREDPRNNRERARLRLLGQQKAELESDLAARGAV